MPCRSDGNYDIVCFWKFGGRKQFHMVLLKVREIQNLGEWNIVMDLNMSLNKAGVIS